MFNALRTRVANPLDSTELKALREILSQDPRNESLKVEIRTLDLELRQNYFYHRMLAEQGARILLVAVVIFLIAIKASAELGKRLPEPDPVFDDPAALSGVFRSSTWALMGVAGLLVFGGVVLKVDSAGHSREVFWASLDGDAPEERRNFPTQEEVAANWPRFRGPGGLGIASGSGIPVAWDGPTGKHVMWRSEVPLPGKNSPVVWGDRVFITGATEDQREVFCYELSTGELLWRRAVDSFGGGIEEPPQVLEDTGYAAPTAATDGQYVYAMFANGDLACFDFSGMRQWVRRLGTPENIYGHASSLLVYKGRVIVLLDQGVEDEGFSALLAIEGKTGATLWRTPRPVPNSWASPIVIATDRGDQIITCANP